MPGNDLLHPKSLSNTSDRSGHNDRHFLCRQYQPPKATFTRPEVIDVYQFQYDLVHKHFISPDNAISNAALSGAVAMSYDDASNAPALRAKQPEDDWRVSKMFRQKEANPCYISAAGSGLVLFNTRHVPEAAAEYMKGLCGEEA